MELFGSHSISFGLVRQQAIKCYALDLAAYPLLLDSIHDDTTSETRLAYEELFSAELLAFAIMMRTKFYQGLDPAPSLKFISASGLLYTFDARGEESQDFTVKDVCDKIIHANSVQKYLEFGIPKPTTTLEGIHGKIKWQFSFSVSIFIEGVLNWLDEYVQY